MTVPVSTPRPAVVQSSAHPGTWYVQSESTPDLTYEVHQVSSVGWRCTCPAGQHGRGCKHVRWCIAEQQALRALLGEGA